MERVAVFIDYENVHRTGHQLYGGVGQQRFETVVDPVAIAGAIVSKRRYAGELAAVYVYRGRPVPEHQSKAASANDVQAESWSQDPRVHVVRRDLRYDFDDDRVHFTAREKGIDVALAVGLVATAMRAEYDVGVVFSCDTDLLPAIELAYRELKPNVELACWSGAKPLWFAEGLKMTPPRRFPYCHFLDENHFLECRDYSAHDGT